MHALLCVPLSEALIISSCSHAYAHTHCRAGDGHGYEHQRQRHVHFFVHHKWWLDHLHDHLLVDNGDVNVNGHLVDNEVSLIKTNAACVFLWRRPGVLFWR
jgi:hypothetical protein